jgi:hypothetical protein
MEYNIPILRVKQEEKQKMDTDNEYGELFNFTKLEKIMYNYLQKDSSNPEVWVLTKSVMNEDMTRVLGVFTSKNVAERYIKENCPLFTEKRVNTYFSEQLYDEYLTINKSPLYS